MGQYKFNSILYHRICQHIGIWLCTNPKIDRGFKPLYSYQYCHILGFFPTCNQQYTGILSMTSHATLSLLVKIKKVFMNKLLNIMNIHLIYYFQYKATSNPWTRTWDMTAYADAGHFQGNKICFSYNSQNIVNSNL